MNNKIDNEMEFDMHKEEYASSMSQVYKRRAEMYKEFVDIPTNMKQIAIKNFVQWHIENQSNSDIKGYLREYLEDLLIHSDLVDRILQNMSNDDIRDSYKNSYLRDLGHMNDRQVVSEMESWDYELPKKEEEPWHLYLLVKLTVDAGSDYQDVVNECDYTFTHDNILGSEILDYRTEQDGDSPVLYIP